MSKINQLLLNWPKGTVYTSSYLHNLGFSNELLYRYKKSGWIASIGKGAYIQKEDKVDWLGGLYAMQKQTRSSAHVAGRTALEMRGLAHYTTYRSRPIYLLGKTGERLPLWFFSLQDAQFCNYRTTDLFPLLSSKYYLDHKYKNFLIQISSPELAVFEMLYNLPLKQSFDGAIKIFENLTSLRSYLVQSLLENCNSIKVKRLFLYFAEYFNYFWIQDINYQTINLGSGKRVIDVNGKLNKKFNITVPPMSDESENSIF